MGGNDNRLVVRHTRSQEFTELALPRNIQSIGRLIHQQQGSIGGQRKAHEDFLFLPHGQGSQISIHIHLEEMQVLHHVFLTETGIELTVQFNIADQGNRRQLELLGYQKHVLQRDGQPAAHVGIMIHHSPTFGSQQTAHQIEQRRLAGSVLTQQTVNPAGFQRK